jgi:DNA topoisomerase-1
LKQGYKLVVVESPTKAKTIRKFLGKEYVVESCMGHIRDLPQSAKEIPEKFKKEKWAQLGVNVEKNFEPLYCIPKDKVKIVKVLKDRIADASELYLATDEDREGESISWHLVEVLKPKVPTKRMVFHEITKTAIQKSLKETRSIDSNLVRAQEARRVLDRLVGYTISPLLWKKVAFGLSAGRVQSVALRLVVEREHERIRFKKSQYWGVLAKLEKDGVEFEARLQTIKTQRVAIGKDFDGVTGKLTTGKDVVVLDEPMAAGLVNGLADSTWIVQEVEERPVFRKPAPPFITSTLQQEANRKLGLSSRETMQVAQKLYEQGFITYMRTDSTALSNEALDAARLCIVQKYGQEYLPGVARKYDGKKAKGAQEAHEAIRPAGVEFVDPEATGLVATQLKLYELIWMRTMASQMVDSRQKQVLTKIVAKDTIFSASGMTIEFPGFLRAYVEGSDDPEAELLEREVRLPRLKEKDKLTKKNLDPTFHETKPPARFTEASLVQIMEKEGIGRPSTYASVISTIIDRGYVRRAATALVPTFTALVVAKLLSCYLPEYVDLKFTSEMEESLDKIAEGDLDWENYLKKIYFGPKGLKAQVEKQSDQIDPAEARTVQLEGLEAYNFHVGRFGAYLTGKRDGESVSASLPDAESPADLTSEMVEKLIDRKLKGADVLGRDPKTGLPIYVLTGRYGSYVQLGEVSDEKEKPKRASLPPNTQPEDVTLPVALELLSLPKVLGAHPGTGKDLKVGLGRFGPYVVHEGDYRSIPKGESLFEMSFERALELMNTPKKGRGRAAPLKILGIWPGSTEEIQVLNGPYGPYLKAGKANISLPEGVTPESVTLEKAIELLTEKKGEPRLESNKESSKKSKKEPKKESKKETKRESMGQEQRVAAPKTKKVKTGKSVVALESKETGDSKIMNLSSLKGARTPQAKAQALGVKKVVSPKKKKKKKLTATSVSI